MFGLSIKFLEIPDIFRKISPDKVVQNYREQLEDVLNRQLVEFPGMLYLVGGGLYGKLHCQLIKSQGGIALDIGSLVDAWLGIPSRPAVYKSIFDLKDTEAGVPSRLLLTTDNVEFFTKTLVVDI
jgi:hypothetical protein